MLGKSWTFGIMCFNEVNSIGSVVKAVANIAEQITTDYEILIVDDGSTDGSREKIQEIALENSRVRFIFHQGNAGIGQTLRSIYLNAQKELVANIPADGQFDPADYLKIKDIPENSFISFFRKENSYYTLKRNLLSALNYYFNKFFLGITCNDINWTKVYYTADIQLAAPVLQSSLIETELCAKLLFLKRNMIEIESHYLERKFGTSKGSSFFILIAVMREMLKVKLELIRFKRSL
ncbi:MAG: glycosyltransferase family 2 protein [Saprospiraceae bacterium]|nr:glycosyltransferase family 2 protein [Saprospiraceae bacterium]